MTEQHLTPTRPYLARAIYAWICDNHLTPYLLVDATQKFVQVPTQYIKDGQIVLNIAPHAIHKFEMDNDALHFNARFGGVSQNIYVPMAAILGIYSRENGQGLFFDPQEYSLYDSEDALGTDEVKTETPPTPEPKKKSHLRLLD